MLLFGLLFVSLKRFGAMYGSWHIKRTEAAKVWMGLTFGLIFFAAHAQPLQAGKDTTIILISDINVQLECSQALNDLYNFEFAKAEQQMRWFKQKYAWHPLPYFLLGLSSWWKIMPNTANQQFDDVFLGYMDSTIMVAERLHKKHPPYRIEAAFFLAAAHGFKGRLYSDEERKSWRKAAAAGNAALNYMEECKEKEYLSPELLFGDALYNYFSVWVPENYPALKPLMWFFRKGDKRLGLEQLKEVSYNAFYTRTEAMVWLMRILSSYENDHTRAFQIAEYLHQTYPNNPYFHRYYARTLYARGLFDELEQEAKCILSRIDSGQVGYEATSGRYAAFFLGQLAGIRRNWAAARTYYEQAARFAELTGATQSGYYLYSLIELGEIAAREGRTADAKRYFAQVKKNSDRKDETFKAAKSRLKKLEKGD
jgi:TolA-binding protein